MTLNCPRCKAGKLEEIEVADVIIDRCTVCAGLWFDQGEVEAMIGTSPSVKAMESIIPLPESENSEMVCPRCSGIPLREKEQSMGNSDSVEVYKCVSCMGTWIDRGVLSKQEDSNIETALRDCFKS